MDSHDSIIHLQRTIGNQAVQRLMRSNVGFDFAKIDIQPKLKVSQPGDVYEQEADRVAEKVMRMSESDSITSIPNKEEGIDRKCAACEVKNENKKRIEISRKLSESANPDGTTIDMDNVRSSSSSPLDSSAREYMDSSFDYDFSNVRIHADSTAAKLASSLDARAFTLGDNIIFGPGQYDPNSIEGKKLLAHELTHVVQQTGYSHPRSSFLGSNSVIGGQSEAGPGETQAGVEKPKDRISKVNGQYIQRQPFPDYDKSDFGRRLMDSLLRQGALGPRSGPFTPQMQAIYDDALKEFQANTADRFLNEWVYWVNEGVADVPDPEEKESTKYWIIALAGNLLWAATSLLAPELIIGKMIEEAATRALVTAGVSFVGAAVGSGLVEKGDKLISKGATPPKGKKIIHDRLAETRGAMGASLIPLTESAARECAWELITDVKRQNVVLWHTMFPYVTYDTRFADIKNASFTQAASALDDFQEQYDKWKDWHDHLVSQLGRDSPIDPETLASIIDQEIKMHPFTPTLHFSFLHPAKFGI
jgi:hypothetical protein